MKIGIVGAMYEEIAYFLDKVNDYETKEINNFLFYTGNYKNKEIVLVESGIGKVYAGILATTLISNFDIDILINVGVAGGLVGKVNIGDVVLGEKIFYGDVDVSSGGNYVFGQLPKCPPYFSFPMYDLTNDGFDFNLIKGDILTSDKFIVDYQEINNLINRFFSQANIVACDMETAAFAQSCYFFKKDFLVIRAISDVIGREDDSLEYNDDNLKNACLNSSITLDYLLTIL